MRSETYTPTKPCQHGHLLRYLKSKACVECCREKGTDPRRKEYYQKQRAEDPDRFRGYSRNWVRSNTAANMYHHAKYRASVKGLDFDIEISDVVIPERCPVFNTPMKKPGIDRIDNNKGYVKGNIAVISGRANRIKSDATLNEIKAITEYMTKALQTEKVKDN